MSYKQFFETTQTVAGIFFGQAKNFLLAASPLSAAMGAGLVATEGGSLGSIFLGAAAGAAVPSAYIAAVTFGVAMGVQDLRQRASTSKNDGPK